MNQKSIPDKDEQHNTPSPPTPRSESHGWWNQNLASAAQNMDLLCSVLTTVWLGPLIRRPLAWLSSSWPLPEAHDSIVVDRFVCPNDPQLSCLGDRWGMLLASWQVSLMARTLWVQGLFKVLFSLLFWFLNSYLLPKTKISGLLDNTRSFWSG